jgi:chromosome segregation ATPase
LYLEKRKTKMNTNSTALENLKEQEKNIDSLVTEEMTLRKRIAAAIKVRREFHEARSNLENAKSVRREVLGTIHLSEKAGTGRAELAMADTAFRDAQQRAELLADDAEGAQWVIEKLEPDAQMLHDQVAALRKKLPALQLNAATAAAEEIIEKYIVAGDEFENSFASVVGALQTIEKMRNSDKAPFVFHDLYPLELEFPDVPYLQERFRAFRPHARVSGLAEVQRQVFIDRLHSQGILDA